MINVISAGACKGLFQALYGKKLKSGSLMAKFGAVGAMQEQLLAGQACELLVLTIPLLEKLAKEKWVIADSIRPIGLVATGIAVPTALAKQRGGMPKVNDQAVLRANLLAATAIHFPDPKRATAGIHFQQVLDQLGIASAVANRCHHYDNGASAMAKLAANDSALGNLQIGCTQVSEILYTQGVNLIDELPEPFQLSTQYAVALTPSGMDSKRAKKMLDRLSGKKSIELRVSSGFAV
jgi:molybdate transport system substrate-binding protein